MKMLKLVEKRRSVREYKNKVLSRDDRKTLEQVLANKPGLAEDASLEFVFVEDGKIAKGKLEGFAGYYGHMIEAPHYYALLSNADNICYKITGYVGEWFILKATQEDIGTCWVEVKDSDKVKVALEIESEKRVVALIAIGYAKKEVRLSNIYASATRGSLSTLTDLGYPNIDPNFSKGPISHRKPLTEFVYLDEWGITPELEELEKRGLHEAFFYMRLAPSYSNRQPWRFIVRGNEIFLAITLDDEIDEAMQNIEAGIAMLYLEVAMHDLGISGQWMIKDIEGEIETPKDQKVVGKFAY
jgi:nitroreductase